MVVKGVVDTTKAGTYEIVYSVTNSFGVTSTRTRTVRVYKPKPVITVLGNNPRTILVGESYVDACSTALDEVYGDLTNNNDTSGTVNPSLAGTYNITYTVTNSYIETTTVKRIVVVKNPETTIT